MRDVRHSSLDLPLRIVVTSPPADEVFSLQRGPTEVASPIRSTGSDLAFDLSVQLKSRSGSLDFGGPFVRGRPPGRFVYINSGKRAGDGASEYDRRAKVFLAGITWTLIEQTLSSRGAVLEGRITGAAMDGGPACATVSLLGPGWRIATR